jgi:Pyrimidine dimer DNA glycosylase
MQTFLPLPKFKDSAAVLDNKRLGKQRVECKQILLCLGVPVGDHTPGATRWRNHPAVRMWAAHPAALAAYAILICREWRRRGFKDVLLAQFMASYGLIRPAVGPVLYPPWFGDPALHASHRSNLLRKDYAYYSQFGWDEPIDLPYIWPTHGDTIAQTHQSSFN